MLESERQEPGGLAAQQTRITLCKAAGGFIEDSLIYDEYCETEGWDPILKTLFFAFDHSIEYEIIGTSEKEFPSLNSLRR